MKFSCLCLCLFVLATTSQAQSVENSPLDRLSDRQELSGWEAVGRVDINGGGFCTGALISPDLVLTAAHCLVEKGSKAPIDPANISFRAGYGDGNSVADRAALQTVVHPDFIDRSSARFDDVSTDLGLIKLTDPIPTLLAAPFQIGEQSVGSAVSVVSYARGRSEALSWQRSCSVRKVFEREAVAIFTCDVGFGSSGAPVFDTSRIRPMIVSVISRGGTEGKETFSLGPLVQEPIMELKEALRTSKGVNVAGGGIASAVQVSRGAHFVKIGEGAKFVKP